GVVRRLRPDGGSPLLQSPPVLGICVDRTRPEPLVLSVSSPDQQLLACHDQSITWMETQCAEISLAEAGPRLRHPLMVIVSAPSSSIECREDCGGRLEKIPKTLSMPLSLTARAVDR